MQDQQKILPEFLNLDVEYSKLEPNESPFIKGMSNSINGNPELGNGQNNPVGEGQNILSLTPTRSNLVMPEALVPAGYNLNIGSYYSITTNEFYYFNYNSEGVYGVYLISGDTYKWSKVIEDTELGFTDDPVNYIANHRVTLRIVYAGDGSIAEKILMFTFGFGWQKWILVNAAIATNGFDANLFPYYTLQQPHYDRRELLEWAMRPPMYNPVIVSVPNTNADSGKVNRMVDQAFQISIGYNYTDGRQSVISPYSLPLIIKSEDFLNNPDLLPKNALITLYAGSCLVESIDIYVRKTSQPTGSLAELISWGDWYKYVRIYKFGDSGSVLGTPYWLRQNAWDIYNYDSVQNTVQFNFDNSLLSEIVDNINFTTRLQNDIPQVSKALTDIADAELLGNNRYGYDNLPTDTLDKISVGIEYKSTSNCVIPLRNISLYAYIGMPGDNNAYYSQVGYFNGQDTTVRFGSIEPFNNTAAFSEAESKIFALDFADKKAFRCYLEGTPYYTDGVWCQVSSVDFSVVELAAPLDFSNADVLQYVGDTYQAGGFFVCKFDFIVPAGRYLASIGRHNIPSDGDYRNTSSYVAGIANSRMGGRGGSTTQGLSVPYTIQLPGGLVSAAKQIEIDCTGGNIDVWGTGGDLFYIFCPYQPGGSQNKFIFIEGYLQESLSSPVPVEYYRYYSDLQQNYPNGTYTDKNGFYFSFSHQSNASDGNVLMEPILFNCIVNNNFSFKIATSNPGLGWKPNGFAYVAESVGGSFLACNRVLLKGTITSLDGITGLSNISVSLVNCKSTQTDSNGNFELIIHNGYPFQRQGNMYVNAGGNFLLSIQDCGYLPVLYYDESLVPCIGSNCVERDYPVNIKLSVVPQGGTDTSLKENGIYSVGIVCADLAGRLTFVNVVESISIPSFLIRNNTLPSLFQLLISESLELPTDMAWFAPYVSGQLNVLSYIQWIADTIVYVDGNGNVVSDNAEATFISINITSLYNNNLGRNFSLLTTYQFVNGDRIRILDNGDGVLLDTETYGEPIDLQILGTNYNQAAMTAGIIPNDSPVPIINTNVNNSVTTNVTAASGTATVTTLQTEQNNIAITLYVKYDSRFINLINKTGLWIELYTPAQTIQTVPYNELQWQPIINNEVANFSGIGDDAKPVYDFPTVIDINFWDTYLFSRDINIPNVGNQFLAHAFESPNISDAFGYQITSGGRKNVKDDNAKQLWYISDIIKSDNYGGVTNGLGNFQGSGDIINNRQDFSQNNWGGIEAVITQRNTLLFICEKDFFLTNFNYHYAYLDQQGRMIANLSDGISTPAQKIGSNYGMDDKSHATLVVYDRMVFWYDINNEAWVKCDYSSARDISDITDKDGRKFGIKSYLTKKTQFISNWNEKQLDNTTIFDLISGIDVVRKNLIISFRPRRSNSNNPLSYISNRRNIDLKNQETIVYNLDSDRWTKFENYVAEGYGNLKGSTSGVEFISFASGMPYINNQSGNKSYLNFFGVQTEPVIVGVFNKNPEIVKIFQAVSLDVVDNNFFVDMIYDNEQNSFSCIPYNMFKKKEKFSYGAILRDMVSYFSPDPTKTFRSTLQDGKRVFGRYMVVRFIGQHDTLNGYFQLNSINSLFTNGHSTKP